MEMGCVLGLGFGIVFRVERDGIRGVEKDEGRGGGKGG